MSEQPQEEGHLHPTVAAWVQQIADRDYDGVFGAAASAILEAAYVAEHEPRDGWSGLDYRLAHRKAFQTPPA